MSERQVVSLLSLGENMRRFFALFISSPLLALPILLAAIAISPAWGFEIEPFKDKRFANAPLISSNEWLRVFEYDELRDVNGRDIKPGYQAKGRYVFHVRGGFRKLPVSGPDKLVHFEAGARAQKTKFMVGFFHGARGSSKLGKNPLSFGGNFGRLHNLVARNGGRYVSFAFSDFGERGATQVAALLAQQKKQSPKAPIILACGSQGSLLCWQLAKSSQYQNLFDGIVLLGGLHDPKLLSLISNSKAPKWPVFIAHGSNDKVFKLADLQNFAQELRSLGVPVRMDVYQSGNHGTPIRMIDWRFALNWMSAQFSGRAQ